MDRNEREEKASMLPESERTPCEVWSRCTVLWAI